MIKKELEILNVAGLHIRIATILTKIAGEFKSEIFLKTPDGKKADLRSVMDLLILGARQGCLLSLEAEGEDEEEAVRVISDLFRNKFGEL